MQPHAFPFLSTTTWRGSDAGRTLWGAMNARRSVRFLESGLHTCNAILAWTHRASPGAAAGWQGVDFSDVANAASRNLSEETGSQATCVQ